MSQENVETVRRAYEAFSRAESWEYVRMAVYNDKAQALEAAGLSEQDVSPAGQ